MSEPRDFWLACGHHLLDRRPDGRLRLTDDFLKAYLARPELVPPIEACAAERELHAALLDEPRRSASAQEIAAIRDADARDNWRHMIGFRDHLVAHESIEAAYVALVRDAAQVPPIFLDQLAQAILRTVLDGSDDVFLLRAAEMLFRPQRLTFHEGSLIAADEEHIGSAASSPLVAFLGLPVAGEIDVLNEQNAAGYWSRSDRFDLALDLTAGRRGLPALAGVIERWIRHLLGLDVRVAPVLEPREVDLSWYVGLDAAATRIGDALWHGRVLTDHERAGIVAFFQLTFDDRSVILKRVAGSPIYLILAMNADNLLRMKPQNLITGLPVRETAAVE